MKKVWFTALLAWIVASVLACGLYPVTLFDPCARYAPMADAFARGDFYYAFHPRFGVLFSVLSGVISLLAGLEGIYAVQVAAYFLLALAAVVMFFFARRLSGDESVAWWTFALTFLAPDFFRYALDGLREPGKCLVFSLLGYALVSHSSWPFAIALVLYIASFTYGFAASSILLALWCGWFLVRRERRMLPLPIFGWMLGTAAVTVCTHAYTGHWLPAPQLISQLGAWL